MAITDEQRLTIYNSALRIIGSRNLTTVSEGREPRRVLDTIWDDDMLNTLLEMGEWLFASRLVQIQSDPDITPLFGYSYVMSLPSDYVRICGVYTDEMMKTPMLDYKIVGTRILTSFDKVYLHYVSNGDSWGGDFTLWPSSFKKLVEAYIALEAAPRLKSQTDEETLKKRYSSALINAQSKDCMKQPTRFPPLGKWQTARRVGSSWSNSHRNSGQF